jgi:hypothetical protein
LTSGGAKNTRIYFGQRDVFVATRCAVGAGAVAELELSGVEVLLEFSPFGVGGVTMLGFRAGGATVGEEGLVGPDQVVVEDGGVGLAGVDVGVSE